MRGLLKGRSVTRTAYLAILAASCSFLLGCSVKNPRLVSGTTAERPPDVALEMRARKYDFEPAEVRVRRGQVVELHLTATDRKHGFELKPFGIQTELPEGQPVIMRFVANQRGEFGFRCDILCGLDHLGMKGKLIVE
jgi:cytochrome c oxidase subunit 2